MVNVENAHGETLAHRALADTSRVAILEELRRAREPLDVAQLTERVGLHRNTVRSHLAVLQRAGLVGGEVGKHEGPGRPRVVYRPLRGALGVMRAPMKAGRLDPFVEPSLCVAHLAPIGSKAR